MTNQMDPVYATNGVYYACVGDDEYYGFVIPNALALETELATREASDMSVEERKEQVEIVRNDLIERGYAVGELVTQSHYAWLVDGFGFAGTYEEYLAMQEEVEFEFDTQDEA